MGYLNTDVVGNEGELLTIQSPVESPVSSLIVHISPKQEGEGTPSPTNVRPIVGADHVTVWKTGKNLCSAATGLEMVEKWHIISSGRQEEYPGLPAGVDFTMSAYWSEPNTPSSNWRLYLNGLKMSGVFGGPSADGPIYRTVTNQVPTDGNLLRIYHNNRGLTNTDVDRAYAASLQNVQLELGSTATAYEPYKGQTMTVNLPFSLYGGYVDLVRGVLVEEWKIIDLGTLAWTKRTSGVFYSSVISDKGDAGLGILCSHYPYNYAYAIDSTPDKSINDTYQVRAKCINICDSDYAEYTLTEFKSAMSGVMCVYKTAVPTETVIAPGTLSLLRGVNHFWTDGDSVDVSYRCAETRDIILSRRQTVLAQPHISDWITGNPIAVYEGDMLAAMKNCRVYFSPAQDGSGDPSPANVRPIIGWTGIRAGTRTSNILNLLAEQAQSTPASSADTTKRSFVPGSCVIGISPSNYYRANYANYVKDIVLTENSLAFTSGGASGYGIGYVLDGVKPGDSVKFSYGEKVNLTIYITAYEADGTFINYQTVDNVTRTVPERASSVLLVMASAKSNELCYVTNPKLEIGSTATAYEPYNGQTVAMDWTTEAGTVYGGYVDLVRGMVVVDTWSFVIDGERNKLTAGISLQNGFVTGYEYIHTLTKNVPDALPGKRPLTEAEIHRYYLCDKLPMNSVNQAVNRMYVPLAGNLYYRAYIDATELGDISTVALMKTAFHKWFADHPVRVVYPLIDPIVIAAIDPVTLKSLRGINNVWSNAYNKIELRYWTHK